MILGVVLENAKFETTCLKMGVEFLGINFQHDKTVVSLFTRRETGRDSQNNCLTLDPIKEILFRRR